MNSVGRGTIKPTWPSRLQVGVSPIHQLPEDLIKYIFSFLDALSIQRVAVASKRCHVIAVRSVVHTKVAFLNQFLERIKDSPVHAEVNTLVTTAGIAKATSLREVKISMHFLMNALKPLKEKERSIELQLIAINLTKDKQSRQGQMVAHAIPVLEIRFAALREIAKELIRVKEFKEGLEVAYGIPGPFYRSVALRHCVTELTKLKEFDLASIVAHSIPKPLIKAESLKYLNDMRNSP